MGENCPLCKMDVECLKVHWRINHKKLEFSPGKVNLGFKGGKKHKKKERIKCPLCQKKVKNLDQHKYQVHPIRAEPTPFIELNIEQESSPITQHNLEFIRIVNSILLKKKRIGLKRQIGKRYPFLPLYTRNSDVFEPNIKCEDINMEIDKLDSVR